MDSTRSSAWLLVAACALTYPAYMAACAAQLLLPTLAAWLCGHVLIDEIRVTPQWLLAFGSSAEPLPRWLIRNGPLLFGCVTAAGAIAASRRSRPAIALFLHQVAIWSLALLAGRSMPSAIAALLVLVGLLSLVRCTSDQCSTIDSVMLGFLLPFLTMLVIVWRVGGRLPGPAPRSGPMLAGVALAVIALALAAIPLGRKFVGGSVESVWPMRSARNAIVAFTTLLVALLLYRPIVMTVEDWNQAHYSTGHFQILYDSDDYSSDYIHTLADEREQHLTAMIERLGNVSGTWHFRMHLFASQEELYARARSTEPYTVDGTDIFALASESVKPDLRADAEALLDAAALTNRSTLPFLRQAMIEYAAAIPDDEAGKVTWQEGPYSLTLLSNPDFFISPIARRILAGEFARWITRDFGPETLLQLAQSGQGGLDWRLPFENRWRAHLLRLAAHWQPRASHHDSPASYHYGVAFSNDGGVRTGYASTNAGIELRKLAARGANSIALTALLPVPEPATGSLYMLAGDPAIDHATQEAHRAGLTVMLKPTAGSSSQGRVIANWNAYRQWMLHYARLAERNGTDLFCIGAQSIALPANAADWRRLIAGIRRVYHGPITFAASPERLLETSVEFWDVLDYIGVDDYLPLTDRDSNTSPATLAEHAQLLAERLEQLSARTRKPVILTEVGYPSSPWGATSPLRLAGVSPVDLELQRRCYQATVDVFHGRSWLAGAYWSRWPSSGVGGGPEDGGFTPLGKPAEMVMAKLWQR